MRVAVVGAGSWGTTLANLLAGNGHEVILWAYEAEVAEAINGEGVNPLYLPDRVLESALRASSNLADVVAGAQLVVSATPCHAVRAVARRVAQSLGDARPPVVSVSKGLEPDTLETMTDVLGEVLPGCPMAALSGPSFAQEVFDRMPTAVVAASLDPAVAETVQQVFSTPTFRVYTGDDLIGVELGGALKNVVAIAAGILEGLGLGHNPRAALITRGLAEMTRLGEALGASPRTFAGLAGMGDLILTATGGLSRNRTLGCALGGGRTLAEALAGKRTVAEGVNTSQVAVALASRTGVEMPIAVEVARVLFEDKPPRQAIRDLMERELKAEIWR